MVLKIGIVGCGIIGQRRDGSGVDGLEALKLVFEIYDFCKQR